MCLTGVGFDVTPFDENANYEEKDVTDVDADDFFEGFDKQDGVPDGDDLEKRQDLSLRMAVDLSDNWIWRRGFAIFLCCIFMGAFLYKSSKPALPVGYNMYTEYVVWITLIVFSSSDCLCLVISLSHTLTLFVILPSNQSSYSRELHAYPARAHSGSVPWPYRIRSRWNFVFCFIFRF